MYKYSKIAICTLLISSGVLYANDGFDDEFDSNDNIKIVKTKTIKQNKLNVYGDVKSSFTYNYSAKNTKVLNTNNNYSGFSSAKLSSNINIDYKINQNNKIKSTIKLYNDFIYTLKSSSYNTIAKDYENDISINELYIQSKLNSKSDFTFGRQIISWGKSDNIRITDNISPLDNKTPGMTDIKDLKLARVMSKFDYFINSSYNISAVILHENRFSLNPRYGSDFAPNNKQMASKSNIKEPANSLKNSGFALELNANLQAQDFSVYFLNDYIDNTTYKTNMLGFAYNKVLDSFLIKSEIAHFDNYDNKNQNSITNALLGVEYKGIKEGSISLELANKNKQIQYALRFTQSYINNTIDYTFLYTAFSKDLSDGGFIRTWLDYDFNDKLKTSFGLIDYIGGSPKFDMIKNNDRVFFDFSYLF